MKRLTYKQHILLSKLLNQATDNLCAAANIVGSKKFTDNVLEISGTIQQKLIDIMRDELEKVRYPEDSDVDAQELYQNIGYPKQLVKVAKILRKARIKRMTQNAAPSQHD